MNHPSTTARPSGRLQLRPVPRIDGPYDDELPEPASAVHGSLALAFPAPTRTGVPLRLVPPADGGDGVVTHGPTRRDALPDPRGWTARLAQAVAEVLAGARPAAQLSRVATLEVLRLLERNAGRLGARRDSPTRRPVVSSVHVSEPRDGIAEVCAVVDTGPRRRALAMRLEGTDTGWRCTALQVG